MEAQYNDLLLTISKDTKQLERLEERLLQCLSSQTGECPQCDNSNKDVIGSCKSLGKLCLLIKHTLRESSNDQYQRKDCEYLQELQALSFMVASLCMGVM